jgi:hypothetical protein
VKYEISDPLFRFWFTFIFPYLDAVEHQEPEIIRKKFSVSFAQYVSFEFESLARRKIAEVFSLDSVGRYWKRDIEIDLLGIKDDKITVGEVKWTNRKMTLSDLEKLKKKCESAGIDPVRYALVSKSGFDDRLIASVSKEDLYLLTLEKLRGWVNYSS